MLGRHYFQQLAESHFEIANIFSNCIHLDYTRLCHTTAAHYNPVSHNTTAVHYNPTTDSRTAAAHRSSIVDFSCIVAVSHIHCCNLGPALSADCLPELSHTVLMLKLRPGLSALSEACANQRLHTLSRYALAPQLGTSSTRLSNWPNTHLDSTMKLYPARDKDKWGHNYQ